MKRFECIKAVPKTIYVATDVTIGKVYEQYIDYDDCDDYYIKDDTGIYKYYDKEFFKEIKLSKNGNIQISVQCLPSLKEEVKAYAKKRTKEELLKTK